MAFQPVPDTAEVTLVFTQNLETITNTFHIEKPGGYTQADINLVADLIDSLTATNLLPIMTQDAIYQQTEVRGLANENDLIAIDGTNGGPGQVLTEGLPNSVTLSCKKLSPFTGRSARGRLYFIGLPNNDLDTNENQVKQTAADSIIIAIEAIRNGVLSGPWTPVIVSRFTNNLERPFGITFDWVNTTFVDRNVDSQRGRLT